MIVKFIRLSPEAKIPVYSSPEAAGADLCALSETPLVIKPGETAMVHTGIAIEVPQGYAALIFARSGLASKRGLAPANKVGVVDSDYRGEVMVALHNHSGLEQTVEQGERVAQLVIVPYLRAEFTETEALSQTQRGEGGFGSTGTK